MAAGRVRRGRPHLDAARLEDAIQTTVRLNHEFFQGYASMCELLRGVDRFLAPMEAGFLPNPRQLREMRQLIADALTLSNRAEAAVDSLHTSV